MFLGAKCQQVPLMVSTCSDHAPPAIYFSLHTISHKLTAVYFLSSVVDKPYPDVDNDLLQSHHEVASNFMLSDRGHQSCDGHAKLAIADPPGSREVCF